jgi:hypothetical protein
MRIGTTRQNKSLKKMTPSEVQSLLLKILARGGDTRLGRGQPYFSQAVRVAAPSSDRPTLRQIMEAVWSLIGRGLAYIDYSQLAAKNSELHLTEAGLATARDEEVNPNDPAGYIQRLLNEVPGISEVVKGYTHEAVLLTRTLKSKVSGQTVIHCDA